MGVTRKIVMGGGFLLVLSTYAAADQSDSLIVAAAQATEDGDQLLKQGTIEAAHSAIKKYQDAVTSWHAAVAYPGREAILYVRIGMVRQSLGETDEARKAFEDAIRAWKEVNPNQKDENGRLLGRAGLAMTRSNLAKLYDDTGEKEKALDLFQQVLTEERAVGSKVGEATMLNNIGEIYTDLGDTRAALDCLLNKALPMWHELQSQAGEGATLNNIGHLFERLGDTSRALGYFDKALPLAAGTPAAEGTTLCNIADAHRVIAAVPALVPSMAAHQ
jgi:tetratricopeptide (TPR) repeat protein